MTITERIHRPDDNKNVQGPMSKVKNGLRVFAALKGCLGIDRIVIATLDVGPWTLDLGHCD